MKDRWRQPKEWRVWSKRESPFVSVVVERVVIPTSNSTKRTHVDVYFPSLLFRSCLDRGRGPCLQSGHRSRTVCEPSRGSNRRESTSIGCSTQTRAMSETLQEVRRRTSEVAWPRDSESSPMAGAPGARRKRIPAHPCSGAADSFQEAEQVQLNQSAVQQTKMASGSTCVQ
jgi:hypothetical protein